MCFQIIENKPEIMSGLELGFKVFIVVFAFRITFKDLCNSFDFFEAYIRNLATPTTKTCT